MAEYDWLGALLGGAAGYYGSQGGNTTTQTTGVSPEFAPLANAVANRGQQIGNMPYTPYGYNQVSDFTPYQYAGFDMIANQAMNSKLPGQAENALGGVLNGGGNQAPQQINPYMGAQSYSGGTNAYMGATSGVGSNPWEGKTTSVGTNPYSGANPYLEQNIQSTLGDMTRSYNQNVAPQMAATAYKSGSFGNTGQQEMEQTSRDMLQRNLGSTAGNMRMQDYTTQQGLAEAGLNRSVSTQLADLSRNAGISDAGLNRSLQGQLADLSRNSGLAESAMNRQMTTSMADLSRNSGLYESGANRAQTGYENAQSRLMQALGMAPGISSMGYQPAQQMLGIGGTMQQQGQNVLNSQYSQFQDAQNWPFKTYDAMMAPFSTRAVGGTTATTGPDGNPVAGLLGGAMLGNSLYNNTTTQDPYGLNQYGIPNYLMPQP